MLLVSHLKMEILLRGQLGSLLFLMSLKLMHIIVRLKGTEGSARAEVAKRRSVGGGFMLLSCRMARHGRSPYLLLTM